MHFDWLTITSSHFLDLDGNSLQFSGRNWKQVEVLCVHKYYTGLHKKLGRCINCCYRCYHLFALTYSWCGGGDCLFLSFSSGWQTNLVDSKDSDLFADESLFAWTTDRLDGSSDVDCSELVVRSAGLMLIQSRLADGDDGVDGWLTDAAQVTALTILLTIAEGTCYSL